MKKANQLTQLQRLQDSVKHKTTLLQQKKQELKIESSLEKIRNVAVSMKRSQQLSAIAKIIFLQLRSLGFDNILHTEIIINDAAAETITGYYYSAYGREEIIKTGYKKNAVVSNRVKNLYKAGNTFAPVSAGHVKSWNKYRKEVGYAIDHQMPEAKAVYYFSYPVEKAALSIAASQKFTQQQIEILGRFRSVFKLSYQRYIDMVNAEAQKREGLIQLALEKVRTRAMAMQSSDELGALIASLFAELKKLDLNLTRSSIWLFDAKTNDAKLWMANSEDASHPVNYSMPFHQHPTYLAFLNAWKKCTLKWEYILEGKTKKDWDDHLFSKTDLSKVPAFIKKGMRAPGKILFSASFNNFGGIHVASLEPLSEEHFNILLRFAKVFDLTYTRFNDLKRAEAQAREAQIEAALERVRARTMAMHKSSDLLDVITILADQFQLLGFKIHSANFNTSYREKDWNLWLYTPGTSVFPEMIHIPYLDSPYFNLTLESAAKGADFSTAVFTKKEKNKFLDHLYANTIAKNAPEERKKFTYNAPGFAWSAALLKNTALTIANYDAEPYTEEQNAVIRRFGQAFEQTYTRFLDLQKAEAQAREAQIEAALEKVRSHALAMHKSEELKDVVTVVFEKLKELNIIVDGGVTISIYTEGSKDQVQWVAAPDLISSTRFRLPYTDDKIIADHINAKESGADFFAKTYSFEEKNAMLNYLFEHTDFMYLPDDIKNWVLQTESYSQSIAFSKNSSIFINSYSGILLSGNEAEILKRFSKVFEQAYIRFLDLQKAEAQARDAQIEAALERVRARTMAMQHSAELNPTADLLFEQLKQLGAELQGVAFAICDRNSLIVQKWTSIGVFSFPYTIEPAEQNMYEAWKNQVPLYEEVFEGERLQKYFETLMEVPAFKEGVQKLIDAGHPIPTWQKNHAVPFQQGYLLIITTKPFNETDIFVRFGKVFEQTYTRFLDLQKAEAQAREAQIEAALERVRSRTMAMQKSDELKEVIQVVFDQFVHLNILVEHAGFYIDYKQRDDMNIWLADKQAIPFNVTLPYFDCATWNSFIDAKKTGKNFIVNYLPFEEKNKFYKDLFKLVPGIPEDAMEYYLSCPALAVSTVLLDSVGLYIENFSGVPYTDEENKILMRFGKVFQQTYTRFLDLQIAEAQARESQIQLALERVRARTMAMQKSDELQQIVTIVFDRLTDLNIKIDSASVIVLSDIKGDMQFWMAVPGQQYSTYFQIPFFDSTTIAKDFFNARQSGANFSKSYTGKEKNEQWNYLFENTDLKNIPGDRKKMLLESKAYTVSVAFTKNTALQLLRYTEEPFSENENEIFQRFANVFEQAYIRFLDLQKAEEQTREAQIEAALERVRARTMAMQHSDELAEISSELFKQVQLLGVPSWYCAFNINDDDPDSSLEWGTSGEVIFQKYRTPREGIFLRYYEAGQKGDDLFINEIGKDECPAHYEYLCTLPGVGEQLLKMKADGIPFPASQIDHVAFFKYGYILFITYSPAPEAYDIFKRFAKVFEQTYTRFLDLQRAEAASKETVKQAALDRIRADIASMRTINDLDRITPLIWNELNILSVPFIRCGVFIMNDEQQRIHTFLSTPDGNAIAAFHIPYNTPGNIKHVVNHWRENKNYIDHWDENAFTTFAETLVLQGALASPEQYLQTIPPGGFYLHFLPFLQGMLYVGNTNQLSEDEINLIQSLADAFSTAYARYEDFNKLEAAKQQIENTLVELKQTQQQLVQSEKMASLGELTAGIAHEIQNPLNFVNNFSEVNKELLAEMKDEMDKGNITGAKEIANDVITNEEKVNHHGKRADAIVKGMLQHSRASTGKKEPTDINALCDEYLRLSFHGMRAKDKSFNADFKTDFDNSIGKINIVPQDIGRVLLNLINNAFYATNEKKKVADSAYVPTVTIVTKKLNSTIEIIVKDNGNGIPQNIIDKIFQPFFTTKPTGSGTGLGLSLAYDIIKAHGGEINVESKEGEGSGFIIQLPHQIS